MWECGLKLRQKYEQIKAQKSLLMWECGLKHYSVDFYNYAVNVTPYVGVWIETELRSTVSLFPPVTPYVGVWIETPIFAD